MAKLSSFNLSHHLLHSFQRSLITGIFKIYFVLSFDFRDLTRVYVTLSGQTLWRVLVWWLTFQELTLLFVFDGDSWIQIEFLHHCVHARTVFQNYVYRKLIEEQEGGGRVHALRIRSFIAFLISANISLCFPGGFEGSENTTWFWQWIRSVKSCIICMKRDDSTGHAGLAIEPSELIIRLLIRRKLLFWVNLPVNN